MWPSGSVEAGVAPQTLLTFENIREINHLAARRCREELSVYERMAIAARLQELGVDPQSK
jgi:hypothetical protein